MNDETPEFTVVDAPKDTPEQDNPSQTWIAHVENGKTIARVKSEDWDKYAKENNL